MIDRYDSPVIELEPEVDLEFKVHTIKFRDTTIEGEMARDDRVETLLNDGWQLDSQINCSPFVMLIFSREKEEKETTE